MRFVTLEGVDGAGKSTHIEFIADAVRTKGTHVIVTREPGGTELAEAIRDYLLHTKQALSPRAELLLFGAARAQHVEEVIREMLQGQPEA